MYLLLRFDANDRLARSLGIACIWAVSGLLCCAPWPMAAVYGGQLMQSTLSPRTLLIYLIDQALWLARLSPVLVHELAKSQAACSLVCKYHTGVRFMRLASLLVSFPQAPRLSLALKTGKR